MTKSNVCVVGLGYVGLTLGVYLARQGKKVYGIEISETILQSLSEKKAHFYEQDFDEELDAAITDGCFTFGMAYQRPKEGSTCFIVTVGTPLGTDGKVNLNVLNTVTDSIATILQDGDTIILRSTVKVGTTREIVKKRLDQSGKAYYLGFCPERTVEGLAFEELAELPQIISGVDEASVDEIRQFFEPVCSELVAMNSLEEAEMVKLLNNSERDLMFALGNEVALMAEEKGLDGYKIIEAANYRYPRSNLKKPGPVGGPCLEKDPYILTEGFLNSDYQPSIFVAGRRVNESIIEKGLERFFARFDDLRKGGAPKRIAILGFAFKGTPPTGDVRGSLVYPLIKYIKNQYPYTMILGHDYLATAKDMQHAGAIEGVNDIRQVLKNVDMVILQNNHPQYKDENWRELETMISQDAMIYDFWNQLDAGAFSGQSRYFSFGRFGQ